MVTFKDIFNENLFNIDFFGAISTVEILQGLIFSFAIGVFIFILYKITFKGVMYNNRFNISIVIMCLITTIIIQTISSNFILSLGMVGALSIVRFRTAVKDPMDIIFMFWAISVGISTGAKFYSIAVIGSLFIGIVIYLMSLMSNRKKSYILVINYLSKAERDVKKVLHKYRLRLKSKALSDKKTELTMEISITDDNDAILKELEEIDDVITASLLNYTSDY